MWTWLHDGKNAIHKDDRIIIIGEIRALVYAKSEDLILTLYNKLLKKPSVTKYPNFIKHLNTNWKKRYLWAHCYRKDILLRGNHTNNYAEAGIKILKELIFSR